MSRECIMKYYARLVFYGEICFLLDCDNNLYCLYVVLLLYYVYAIVIYCCMSSSSSCRTGSTDIPDPLSPLLPIVHRPRQVFRTTSRILTYLLNACSCWSSCFCTAMCGVHKSTSLYERNMVNILY